MSKAQDNKGGLRMNIYVWRGEKVLKNYASGLVVVSALSVEEAWAKLRSADFYAFAWLKTGSSWFHDDNATSDEELAEERDENKWTVPEPEVFTVDTLPVLVKHGGE